MNGWRERVKRTPVLFSVVFSVCIGICICFVHELLEMSDERFILLFIQLGFLGGIFFIHPVVLTMINVAAVFILPRDDVWKRNMKRFEYVTLILGTLYSLLALTFMDVFDVILDAQWQKVLYNQERHQPVWSGALPTVLILCAVGLAGYLVLSLVRLEKMPPLVIVLSISAMYLGVFQCAAWCVQIGELKYWLFCLFPFNCIVIAMKTIRCKIAEWNQQEKNLDVNGDEKTILTRMNNVLRTAEYWPFVALVLMLPLLGLILCVLVLFGQRPDDFIKAWTETADWRLSGQTAPPNIMMDEHYLCTVAAGGHAKLVKPIRMGERHGHRVVVNRQLCIANAFEQILEERTPKFHHFVRHVYDTCGFPIARWIQTKRAADVVYLLMKPLEWIFLIVLYLCDVKPENRIALQYLPRKAELFKTGR